MTMSRVLSARGESPIAFNGPVFKYSELFSMLLLLVALILGGLKLHQSETVAGLLLRGQLQNNKATASRHRPRCVKYVTFTDSNEVVVERLDMGMEVYPTKRKVKVDKDLWQGLQDLLDDEKYDHNRKPRLEDGGCKAQYDWQLKSYPTCNKLHEVDLFRNLREDSEHRKLGTGCWRDTWQTTDHVEDRKLKRFVVTKTLRLSQDFADKNYERHRTDAMIHERLTRFKTVIDMYAFCGYSSVVEYASGGDIRHLLKKDGPPEPLRQLEIATQAAMGLAALHNSEKEGVSAVSHTDIDEEQYVSVNGIYKLGDFNRAELLPWNTTSNTACGYRISYNGARNRSPEEYAYQQQTEKVDIYQFGTMLFKLMTGKEVFDKYDKHMSRKNTIKGKKPPLPDHIDKSKDPIVQVLKQTLSMCFVRDPMERATARQIEAHLVRSLNEFRPSALQMWGLQHETPTK